MIIDTDANATDELVADFAKTLDGALSGGTEAKAALRRMYIAAVEHASDLRAINALLVSEVRAATHDHCPYCGEAVELLLDPAGGDLQEYVEDCEVCCRPWRVEVTYDETGAPSVELFTDDE